MKSKIQSTLKSIAAPGGASRFMSGVGSGVNYNFHLGFKVGIISSGTTNGRFSPSRGSGRSSGQDSGLGSGQESGLGSGLGSGQESGLGSGQGSGQEWSEQVLSMVNLGSIFHKLTGNYAEGRKSAGASEDIGSLVGHLMRFYMQDHIRGRFRNGLDRYYKW